MHQQRYEECCHLPNRCLPAKNFTNALEADNRIWLHATQVSASRILICSPDTDVYNIGLTAPVDKDYVIELNAHHAIDKKYLVLKNLQISFQRDPDLHTLPRQHLNSIMQSLYISTGCDYTSFCKTFGKATIINHFMQYANFITGSTCNAVGSLHQTNSNDKDTGFLSFVRLIGTCYFKKNIAAFISNYGHMTPLQLYNSVADTIKKA